VRNPCLIEDGQNVSERLSLPGIRVSDWRRWAEYLLLLSIARPCREADSLNVRIMSTISNMDAEERHKALQAFEYLREAKVNLLEKVRYGAPTADIESVIEEFEDAWAVADRLVNQLIAPSKPSGLEQGDPKRQGG